MVTWAYRCSICDELVEVDDVKAHLEAEQAKDDWPGVLTWTREDREES